MNALAPLSLLVLIGLGLSLPSLRTRLHARGMQLRLMGAMLSGFLALGALLVVLLLGLGLDLDHDGPILWTCLCAGAFAIAFW